MEKPASPIRFVTRREIPYEEAFYGEHSNEFMLLNMLHEIWYVDKKHPQWEQIKETALNVAKTFGDSKTIEQLQAA